MVEIEGVLNEIRDGYKTIGEIAVKLNCSDDAVNNVLLWVAKHGTPKLYSKVAKGKYSFAFTTNKLIGEGTGLNEEGK